MLTLLNPNQANTGDGAIVGGLRHDPTDWRDLQPFGDQQFEISAQTLRVMSNRCGSSSMMATPNP